MNTRTTSKSALFLMELILAIFFFSLASAVCIQLFVKAHLLGNDTTNRNHAVMWAQNIAEAYLGNDGDFKSTAKLLNGISDSSNSFSLYFDPDWNVISSESGTYKAVVQLQEASELDTIHIMITCISKQKMSYSIPLSNASKGNDVTETPANIDTIYELSVSKHTPRKAD